MPAIPKEFFTSLTTVKGASSTTAEFQHLLNHRSILEARGIAIDDMQRWTLLRELASGLAFLHKRGVCVGDISPKNLLFSLTPREAVYFIDCDAMRVAAVSALPQIETPGWEVPAGEELATVYSDAYKLGLLALRLLAGDHGTTNPQHLPATTPAMMRQIITEALKNQPQQRPLPEAWTYILASAIEVARHHALNAPPSTAALAAPPTPVVHSRPRVHSATPGRRLVPPPPAPAPDFWLDVGIDPIKIVTSTREFLTLRCYLDDAPIFLGGDGMIDVFRSEQALRSYLARNPDNDMSSLSTYPDILDAAIDGSLPSAEVADENFYLLKGVADDIAAGPRRVDVLRLELAVELLRDVGNYVEDSIVEDYLESGQPLGALVQAVAARSYARDLNQAPKAAASQWTELEEFLESRLRVR